MARRTRGEGVDPPSTVLFPRALITGVMPSCSNTLLAGAIEVDIAVTLPRHGPRLSRTDDLGHERRSATGRGASPGTRGRGRRGPRGRSLSSAGRYLPGRAAGAARRAR